MKNVVTIKGLTVIGVLIVVVLVLFWLAVIGTMNRAVVAVKSCAEFKSRKEIIDSFRAGNIRLDRDNDGIPCENSK